ncbi:HNH endonuclease [Halorubrum sp. RMP-47]|uniref:HNH endonuclease n=1 Tax=Halorubrum miltondacostae TaxID=3076378 RepID=UPI003528EC8D
MSDEWIGRFKNTVQTPVERDSDAPDTIASLLPARVWGATAGSQTEQYFDEMRPRDCVLFYRDGDFFAGGIVGRTLDDHSVGAWIWDNPESRFIFTLEEYYDWAPAITRIWDALGYNGTPRVQGFLRVKPARLENLCGDEKSLERALFGTVNETLSETAGNSPGAASSAHDQSPEGTTTERDRLLRDQTLVTELKSLYNHTCQLCGYRLQRGLDAGYAEVHHIKPLGDPHCGPDVPENMLVLCPNHHVDFDNGMLTVAPASYTVNHMYDDSVSDSQLTLSDGHQIRAAFLDYHNEVIAE